MRAESDPRRQQLFPLPPEMPCLQSGVPYSGGACSVAGTGLMARLIAIPAGIASHQYVLPVMGQAAQTGIPASALDVYHPAELIVLALSGLVIAVAGALDPAGAAAGTRTAFALRAE